MKVVFSTHIQIQYSRPWYHRRRRWLVGVSGWRRRWRVRAVALLPKTFVAMVVQRFVQSTLSARNLVIRGKMRHRPRLRCQNGEHMWLGWSPLRLSRSWMQTPYTHNYHCHCQFLLKSSNNWSVRLDTAGVTELGWTLGSFPGCWLVSPRVLSVWPWRVILPNLVALSWNFCLYIT